FEEKGTNANSEVNPRWRFKDACRLGRTHRKIVYHRSQTLHASPEDISPAGFRLYEPVTVYVRMGRQMRVVEKRQLLSAEEINRTLQRLAHEIVEKSGGTKDLALIGVRRRGVPLAHRLSSIIRDSSHVEVPVGTLDITLYRDDLSTVGPQPIVHSNEIDFPVDGRDLVLVDDVLYTGRTIRAAMNGLFDLGRPRRIRLCVMIDR